MDPACQACEINKVPKRNCEMNVGIAGLKHTKKCRHSQATIPRRPALQVFSFSDSRERRLLYSRPLAGGRRRRGPEAAIDAVEHEPPAQISPRPRLLAYLRAAALCPVPGLLSSRKDLRAHAPFAEPRPATTSRRLGSPPFVFPPPRPATAQLTSPTRPHVRRPPPRRRSHVLTA